MERIKGRKDFEKEKVKEGKILKRKELKWEGF